MTLILSALSSNGHFSAFADVLISRLGEHDDLVTGLPSHPQPSNIVRAGLTLSGFSQKIVQIDADHSLLWAGSQVAALAFARAYANLIKTGWRGSLGEAFNELEFSEDDLKGVSLISHRPGTAGGLIREYWECKSASVGSDSVIFAGTGQFHFLDSIQPEEVDGPNPGITSILKWLFRIGTAFFFEVSNQETFDFAYGGWFEALIFADGVIQKCPYLIKRWHIQDDKLLSLPAYGCWYDNHTLYLYQVHPSNGGNVIPLYVTSVADFLGRDEHSLKNDALETYQEPKIQLHLITGPLPSISVVPMGASDGTTFDIQIGPNGLAMSWADGFGQKLRERYAKEGTTQIKRPYHEPF